MLTIGHKSDAVDDAINKAKTELRWQPAQFLVITDLGLHSLHSQLGRTGVHFYIQLLREKSTVTNIYLFLLLLHYSLFQNIHFSISLHICKISFLQLLVVRQIIVSFILSVTSIGRPSPALWVINITVVHTKLFPWLTLCIRIYVIYLGTTDTPSIVVQQQANINNRATGFQESHKTGYLLQVNTIIE